MGVRRAPVNSIGVNAGYSVALFAGAVISGAAAVQPSALYTAVGGAGFTPVSAVITADMIQEHVASTRLDGAGAVVIPVTQVTKLGGSSLFPRGEFYAKHKPLPGAIDAKIYITFPTVDAIRSCAAATTVYGDAALADGYVYVDRRVSSSVLPEGIIAAEAGMKYVGDSFFTWWTTTNPYALAGISFDADGIRVLDTYCAMSMPAQVEADTIRDARVGAGEPAGFTATATSGFDGLRNLWVDELVDIVAGAEVVDQAARRVLPTSSVSATAIVTIAPDITRYIAAPLSATTAASATPFCIRFHEYPTGNCVGTFAPTARTYYPWATTTPTGRAAVSFGNPRVYNPFATASLLCSGAVTAGTPRVYSTLAYADVTSIADMSISDPRTYSSLASATATATAALSVGAIRIYYATFTTATSASSGGMTATPSQTHTYLSGQILAGVASLRGTYRWYNSFISAMGGASGTLAVLYARAYSPLAEATFTSNGGELSPTARLYYPWVEANPMVSLAELSATCELNIDTSDTVVFARVEAQRDFLRSPDQRVYLRGVS